VRGCSIVPTLDAQIGNSGSLRSIPALVLTSIVVASLSAADGVPWGLDRIDQRALPLDGRFDPSGDGSGVHAYVIDSGVRRTHREFEGRVDWVGDFVSGTSDQPGSPMANDCDPPPSQGHGTHVASILAGQTVGVARGVRVHALRILPCTGTTRTNRDATVRAVDWITAHGSKPAVVNISPARWETPDPSLDDAIRRSIRAGFVYVLSAGGVDDLDAHTPQRVAEAIKVASTTAADAAAQNGYGPHLTLFAPGVAVEGAGNASDTAIFSGDGDSYAAPFVAGVAALFLQRHPGATPADVKDALLAGATRDVVSNPGQSPNLLLHVVP
jgi:subtilisin family serine protease